MSKGISWTVVNKINTGLVPESKNCTRSSTGNWRRYNRVLESNSSNNTWLNANKLSKYPYCSPISHNGGYSGGTGFNHEITWPNNWQQTQLELPRQKLTKKIAWKIGAMKRARHLVPQATFHLIYQASVQPHVDYRSTVEDFNLELTFCFLPP